jgi:hypothetical protein
VFIVEELTYGFKSTDNLRCYPREIDLTEDMCPSSIYGLSIDGISAGVVGAGGGGTGVGSHSALTVGDCLYLAIGNQIACFSLTPFALRWSAQGDIATCFGIHYSSDHDALICHGEIAISRWSRDGELVWEQGGRDIFTGDLLLCSTHLEVSDFLDHRYRFAYEDGREMSTAASL